MNFVCCLISLFILSVYCDNCKVVINEINTIDPKKPETKEFIELKSTCDLSVPLRGYKLIGFECFGSTGKIGLVVNLWNERIKSRYYTIGGSDVNGDIKVPNDNIKFTSALSTKKNVQSVTSFFTNQRLSAIGLLYGEKEPFNDIKLSDKKTELLLNGKLIEILKKNLVDMVVYGSKNSCDKCKLFDIIHEDFANKKYALCEFPNNIENGDISLNRCAFEGLGFLPEKFKLGKPTPGEINDCNGPHFMLEDNILSVMPPVLSVVSDDDFDDLNGASCSKEPECTSSSIQQSDFNQITTQRIEEAISNANSSSLLNACTPMYLFPDGGNTEQMIIEANARKRQISNADDAECEWESSKHFK